MDEIEIQKKIEEFLKAFPAMKEVMDRLGESFKYVLKSQIQAGKRNDDLNATMQRTAKDIEASNRRFKKSAAELSKNIDDLSKDFANGQVSAEELDNELKRLRDQVNKTTKQSDKELLQKKKEALEEANARNKAGKLFTDSLGKMAGGIAAGASKLVMGSVKSALGGADGMSVAAEAMQSSIDVANGATQVGASSLSSFGAATAGAGGKVGKMGLAASIAGAAIGFLGNTVSELAKAGIGFLLKETQKSISAFQQMNASGAAFSGGMIEMRTVANSAGLTLDQFSKVVSENSQRMAEGGMTATDAARELGKVGEIVKKSGIQQSLLNLGYSFEEQASMTAKVMGEMNRGLPKNQRATAQEVATTTADYAENLRKISDLTGENAKTLEEKIRSENTELAFEIEKSKMSKDQRAALKAQMASMSEIERKNLRERMVYGTVINKAGAIFESTVAGAKAKGEETADALRKNELVGNKSLEIARKHNDEMNASILKDGKQLAMAGMAGGGGGTAGEASKAMAGALENTRQFNKENIDSVNKDVAGAKEGTGSKDITEAQRASQDFSIQLEEIATKALPQFASALKTTMEGISKAVGSIGSGAASMASNPLIPILINILGAVASLAPLLMMRKTGGAAAAAEGLSDAVAGGGGKSSNGGKSSLPGNTTRADPSKTKGGGGKSSRKSGKSSLADTLTRADPSKTKGGGGILGSLAEGLEKFGTAKALKGTVTLIALGGALFVTGKAIQEFTKVKLADVGKAGLALAGLSGVAIALGKFSPVVIKGAMSLVVMAGALFLTGKAIQEFTSLKWEDIGKAGVALLGLGAVAAAAGLLAEFIIPGALAIGVLGLALRAFPVDTLTALGKLFDQVGTTIGKVVTQVFAVIPPIIASVGNAIATVGSAVSGVITSISALISQVGTSISTTISSISKSLLELSSIEPGKLLMLAPGIAAVGLSLVPFGVGGALASLLMDKGGFKNITDGLKQFESLDAAKLVKVAEAMKKVNESMPNASQMVAAAASGFWDKLTSSTPAAGPNSSATQPKKYASGGIVSDATAAPYSKLNLQSNTASAMAKDPSFISTIEKSQMVDNKDGSSKSKSNSKEDSADILKLVLRELKKLTELFQNQNEISKESTGLMQDLVDTSSDHKHISSRIYRATV